jgi:hypothetical protein
MILAPKANVSMDAFKMAGRKLGLSGLITSIWDFDLYRNGRLIDHERVHNLITDQGLNSWLNIMFNGGTQITTWYIALFSTNTTILNTHTYAAPGYTEVSAKVDEAARVAFVEAASTAQSITNSANKALYTFNDSETIYGAALVGGGTDPTVKANTAGGGTLFAAAKFTASKAVANDDILATTVTITLANA